MIDNLTEQEKSVLLARAMGWETDNYQASWDVLVTRIIVPDIIVMDYPTIKPWMIDNLYDSANMALAWRVLIWWQLHTLKIGEYFKLIDWWTNNQMWIDENAQRAWLDKILELAIEAGIVGGES